MTIPIYNIDVLPCIVHPMKNTHQKSKKYLGGVAVVGNMEATIKVKAKNNTEMSALYDFWRYECNYGLEPFLMPLPLFGSTYNPDYPDILVQFDDALSADKNNITWTSSIKIKVLGTIDYIVDDQNNFIVSDTGEYTVDASGNYVATGNIVDTYRKVVY